MPSLRYLHVDVFTRRALAGNPLTVFPQAEAVSPRLMQQVAAEMAFPETTFVLPPEDPTTEARVRIFTPQRELTMAGRPSAPRSPWRRKDGRAAGRPHQR